MMNGLPATPPNPNDPAQFAKDYYVTTTALDVNYAVATGAAWTGWVAAQVAADTTRDNAIINAAYQLGVDQANAANVLVTSQIAAEDVYADDMININADYAIAVNEKSADIEGDIVNAETNFELAEHAAAQIAGKAVNLAEKDRAHDYADADETRAETLALEDEDLANDLAVEEEIRQNAYAAGEATWLLDEAAAHIASTSIAAAATSSFLTGLAGADFVYLTTAAPLITTATQAFNNLVDADYVAAFPGDADQAAVSGAWTSFFNAMANAAQTAITTEASAYQAYINGMAADIQTTMNNMAGEATALAGSYGAALVNLVSTVGAAATLHTSQAAAAGVVWVDTVATDVKNSEKAAANAWLVMADAGVDALKTLADDFSNHWLVGQRVMSFAPELKTLADDFSNHWNSFAHSYLGAAAVHGTNVINEDRLAARNMDSELTTLAQGVAAEQHDLNLDALNEGRSTALALSPLDDALVNADVGQHVAQATLEAWMAHASTQSTPVSDFASQYPNGSTSSSIGAQVESYFGESCLTSSNSGGIHLDTATEEFISNFHRGALAGDFAEDTGWGGVAGQTTVGMVPVVGQIADVRDTAAAIGQFGNGGWQRWSNYLNLAAVAMAWIPGMDWVKGGKKAAGEIVQSTTKKVATPTVKLTQFGPKIADAVPTNGVPDNWSLAEIQDAVIDYRISIATRKAEQFAFELAGGGNATEALAHARRITEEEDFLASLLHALENHR